MDTFKLLAKGAGLIAGFVALAYLVTVGFTWLALWLYGLVFHEIIINVWAVGGLVFIALWILKSIFKK